MTEQEMKDTRKYIESTLVRMRMVKVLVRVQFFTVLVCWACIALSIWLSFSGGRSAAVISAASFGTSLGIFSYLLGKYIEKSRARFEELDGAFKEVGRRATVNPKFASSTCKIPLVVGFANLIGESVAPIVAADVRDISGLFHKVIAPPAHQIPAAEVLFVYANLVENGGINPDGKSGIRQIIELTNAAIVIVASPNSSESIKKAIELPGPKTANIIFTLDRNGDEFGNFFSGLFEKMRDGKEMLSAWVELAPQVPAEASLSGPQTLLIAERGKIAFPSGTPV